MSGGRTLRIPNLNWNTYGWRSKEWNKHSKLLLRIFYHSEAMHRPSIWLDKFEDLISYIMAHQDGLLVVTGDMNFCLLSVPGAPMQLYISLLDAFNINQVTDKPTRTNRTSRTLLNHIIINDSAKITPHGVIPCGIVSVCKHLGSLLSTKIKIY